MRKHLLRTSPGAILKLALGLMMLILSLAACSGESTSTSVSSLATTSTVLPVNSTVAGTAATTVARVSTTAPSTQTQLVSQIQSQGLGLSKTEWEKLHGSGVLLAQGFPSFQYEKGQYQVIIANDQITQIEQRWISQPISVDMAKEESKKLYPADAKFVKSAATATKDNVDIFFSDMAKQAFASIPNTTPLWPGGLPGNFTVTYRQTSSHQIESIVIALGINPT